jgi:argininosuccinate lyase
MTLWGGRFQSKMDQAAWELNTSLPFDQRLALEDVQGSFAWAVQLAQIGVLSDEDYKGIHKGLKQIQSEFQNQTFKFSNVDEDIHSAVERRLYELAGNAAGKLHTGRSRNDQVATDFRLWVMNHIPLLNQTLQDFQKSLLARAEKDMGVLMPAYTHLQRAQPILLSHWWMSHFWAIQRDHQRMDFVRQQTAVLPLGSGAVAGTSFPVDRNVLAVTLGFDHPCENSIDGVSDRDFVAEFLFAMTLCATHLSKLAEQVVLFSSAEFGFITLSDSFSTGSSLMPQKKNPDVFELTRGKAGSLLGGLTGFLSTLKGLPSSYDKDLQEDKVPVFQAFDTLMLILPVLTGALQTLKVDANKMAAAIDPSVYATDLADELVKAGLPFREAHALVGKAVQFASENNKSISQLTQQEWQILIPDIELEWTNLFSPQKSIETRNCLGGTSPSAVEDQLNAARRCFPNNI